MRTNYNWSTRVYTHKCVVCGNEFTAKRSDAKTCGETCRKRYSHRAEDVQKWAEDATYNVLQMISHAQRYPDLDKPVRDILTNLVSTIQAALEKEGVK